MFFLFVQVIVQYPPTKPLSSEEGDLIWKFRFYLSNQKKVKYIFILYWPNVLLILVHPNNLKLLYIHLKLKESYFCKELPLNWFVLGFNQVFEVGKLGRKSRSEAGSGAASEVESDGCGRRSGATHSSVHASCCQKICCYQAAACWWWSKLSG